MPTNTAPSKQAASAKDPQAKPVDSKAPAKTTVDTKEAVLTFEQQLKALQDDLHSENTAIVSVEKKREVLKTENKKYSKDLSNDIRKNLEVLKTETQKSKAANQDIKPLRS